MKPTTKKKLNDIRGRVRDLKAVYVGKLSSDDPDERLIPRVCAIVIREGKWLIKLTMSLGRKVAEKTRKTFKEEDKAAIEKAAKFFNKVGEDHEDEVSKNDFIYRMDPIFIAHLENLVIICRTLDAQLGQAVAANIDDDAEDQEELDALMTAK